MSEPALGVLRQLEAEKQSAEHLNIEWHSVLYTGKKVPGRVTELSPVSSKNRLLFRISYYRWLLKITKNFDVILLRYSFHDPFQLLYVLLCRKPVYSVHHTLEVPELSLSKSKFNSIKVLIEKILGPLTLSFVKGIIAVLPEIRDYELDRRLFKRKVPSTVYTNGIDYYDRSDLNQNAKANIQRSQNEAPKLLFISSVFAPWQGLEELAAAASASKENFICHIVGELNHSQEELIKKDRRFTIHGLQDKDFINDLISRCDLGLSALALYKKNLKNVPALKLREYLKEGLAVYAGHGDVLPDSYKYFKNGPIEMNSILEFANKNKKNDRLDVSESARPYIEKEKLLSDLSKFLHKNENV